MIKYLKYVNLGEETNHGCVNEYFAVDNCRKQLKGLDNDTDTVPDSQVRRGLHAKDDRVDTVKKAEPFSTVRPLPTNIMQAEHHILDEKLDLNFWKKSQSKLFFFSTFRLFLTDLDNSTCPHSGV
jgi:hypothetical protein